MEDLQLIRKEYAKAPQFSSNKTHEAYIVKLWINPSKFTIGVNYWNKEDLKTGVRFMEGGIRCEVIAPLYN